MGYFVCSSFLYHYLILDYHRIFSKRYLTTPSLVPSFQIFDHFVWCVFKLLCMFELWIKCGVIILFTVYSFSLSELQAFKIWFAGNTSLPFPHFRSTDQMTCRYPVHDFWSYCFLSCTDVKFGKGEGSQRMCISAISNLKASVDGIFQFKFRIV